MKPQLKWTRAKDGAIFGVCKGIARALDLPVGVVRLIWILAVLFAGTGIFVYVCLAIGFPREDRDPSKADILGVCARLAPRLELEVGIVRAISVFLFFTSAGTFTILYLIAYLVLPDQPKDASDSNASTPPSTT